MKKILKNKFILAECVCCLISLLSLLINLLVAKTTTFTILFILNVLLGISIFFYAILSSNKNELKYNLIWAESYIFLNLLLIYISAITLISLGDKSSYTNLMYVCNLSFYIAIYSLFVLFTILFSVRIIISRFGEIKKS